MTALNSHGGKTGEELDVEGKVISINSASWTSMEGEGGAGFLKVASVEYGFGLSQNLAKCRLLFGCQLQGRKMKQPYFKTRLAPVRAISMFILWIIHSDTSLNVPPFRSASSVWVSERDVKF